MFDISLIIPTYGRFEEVRDLMQSLADQDYDLSKMEVIVVDQNDKINLTPIVESFSGRLNIKHVKSSIKGIARSKNIGLEISSADVISFPDDDCKYYPDTVSSAMRIFDVNKDFDIIYAILYDRERNVNIMRNWSPRRTRLNMFNFHLRYSAVTCFTRIKDLKFDERFGVGSALGMGEELDYIMRALKSDIRVYYTPEVSMWHPELNVGVMSDEKAYSYAKGYAATFKKNLNFSLLFVFMMSLGYIFFSMLIALLKLDKAMARKRWIGLKARLDGFWTFKRIK